jgi:hypothetical protein
MAGKKGGKSKRESVRVKDLPAARANKREEKDPKGGSSYNFTPAWPSKVSGK